MEIIDFYVEINPTDSGNFVRVKVDLEICFRLARSFYCWRQLFSGKKEKYWRKKFWRSLTPVYQKISDYDPIPF